MFDTVPSYKYQGLYSIILNIVNRPEIEAFQYDPYLVLCGKLTAGLAADLTNYLLSTRCGSGSHLNLLVYGLIYPKPSLILHYKLSHFG